MWSGTKFAPAHAEACQSERGGGDSLDADLMLPSSEEEGDGDGAESEGGEDGSGCEGGGSCGGGCEGGAKMLDHEAPPWRV